MLLFYRFWCHIGWTLAHLRFVTNISVLCFIGDRISKWSKNLSIRFVNNYKIQLYVCYVMYLVFWTYSLFSFSFGFRNLDFEWETNIFLISETILCLFFFELLTGFQVFQFMSRKTVDAMVKSKKIKSFTFVDILHKQKVSRIS